MSAGTERTNQAFVQAALAGTRLAQVQWVSETGSTNDDLVERARHGGPEQVLIADLQTAGKGRRDRVWDAPAASGVLMSVLVRSVTPLDGFWSVGAIALAASQAIGELTQSSCTLKWPNDVMLGAAGREKKVAGVLAQLVDNSVVVGIGINANWPDHVPNTMSERGTAVNLHTADRTNIDRAELAAAILQRGVRHLDMSRTELRDAWKAQCSTLGQHVRLELQGRSIVGIATDIAADGALQIEENGVSSTHQVGDVVHLRAAR